MCSETKNVIKRYKYLCVKCTLSAKKMFVKDQLSCSVARNFSNYFKVCKFSNIGLLLRILPTDV